ncbi:hypothetical protein Pelo_14423 [Pelomyxa schiedti]|nr:hypothetical protein Pelo_14423 [Pelomyxa schiedti]
MITEVVNGGCGGSGRGVCVGRSKLYYIDHFICTLEIRYPSVVLALPHELRFDHNDNMTSAPAMKHYFTATAVDRLAELASFKKHMLFNNRDEPRPSPLHLVHTFSELGYKMYLQPSKDFSPGSPLTVGFRSVPISSPHPTVPLEEPARVSSNTATEIYTCPFEALTKLIEKSVYTGAAQIHIEWNEEYDEPMVMVLDNGGGMTHTKVNELLQSNSHTPGLFTGSLRIAQKALVFTISNKTASVGLFSDAGQRMSVTFLYPSLVLDAGAQSRIEAEEILDQIFRLSPIKSQVGLGLVFAKILALSHGINRNAATGTCVMLYNLRRIGEQHELMHVSETNDIYVRPVKDSIPARPVDINRAPISSLKDYCAMRIQTEQASLFLCGQEVPTVCVHSIDSKTGVKSVTTPKQASLFLCGQEVPTVCVHSIDSKTGVKSVTTPSLPKKAGKATTLINNHGGPKLEPTKEETNSDIEIAEISPPKRLRKPPTRKRYPAKKSRVQKTEEE